MNSYDKAHELAKSLKNDPIILEFNDIKKRIEVDKDLNEKIEHFKNSRLELQLKSFEAGSVNEEAENKVKKEYQELLANPLAVEFFEKEVKVNVLISDIQQIIYGDLKDLL